MVKRRYLVATVIVAVVIIAAIVAAWLSLGGLGVRAPKPPLKIACFEPFSGMPLSAAFSKDGYDFALKQWRELKGSDEVAGRKIQIIYIDTELKPEIAKQKARDVVLREGAEILIGEEASSIEITLGMVAKELGVFTVIGNAVADSYTTTYYYDIYPNTVVVGGFSTNPVRGMAKFIVETAPKGATVTCLSPNYVWGWDCWKRFKEDISKLRPDIVILPPESEAWPKLGERVFEPFISSVMAWNPTYVFSAHWGDDAVALCKQIRAMKANEKTIFIMSTMSLDELHVLGRDYAIGNVVFGGFGGYWWEDPNPVMQKFGQEWLKTYGYHAGYSSTTAYMGLYLALQLVEATGGSAKPQDILAVMFDRQWDTFAGKSYVRKVDHQLMLPYQVGLTKVIDEPPYHSLQNMKIYSGEEVSLTPEELQALRAQAKK
jgi:branched-chain amino acid transport system substrate-binding protein